MRIRPAISTDLSILSLLWYDQTVIQLQSDRRFSLAQNSPARWETAASLWLRRDDMRVWVTEADAQLLGYIVAQLQPAPVGLVPERMGHILELVVDLHTQRLGIGSHLLQEATRWLRSEGIEVMTAQALHRHVVGQAFWRTQGATEWMDLLWMKL